MKTKYPFFVLFLGLGLSLFLVSCKKGEEDPGISFRSRKNRISNDWILQKGAVVIKTYPPTGGSYQTNILYNTGGTYTVSRSDGYTESGGYTIEFNLYKDGHFSKEHNETPPGSTRGTSTEEGTWHFSGGGGSVEKKELLVLHKEKSSFISQNAALNTTINYNGGNLFDIVRLAKNEMILSASQRVTSGGTISEITEEWTFIPD